MKTPTVHLIAIHLNRTQRVLNSNALLFLQPDNAFSLNHRFFSGHKFNLQTFKGKLKNKERKGI